MAFRLPGGGGGGAGDDRKSASCYLVTSLGLVSQNDRGGRGGDIRRPDRLSIVRGASVTSCVVLIAAFPFVRAPELK